MTEIIIFILFLQSFIIHRHMRLNVS